MIEADRTDNEIERLLALRSYEVLDTEPEPQFDALVHLAQRLFSVPTVLISFIDVERQWFKARIGCNDEFTPRHLSFCAHALLTPDQLLVVPDARLDSRFNGHPNVGIEGGICFYAGAPLVNDDGFVLGTLCLVDSQPRELSPEDQHDLLLIAKQVVGQLELRRSMIRLKIAADHERKMALEHAAATSAKSEFLANMSHEIRSPLTSILGYAEMLLDAQFSLKESNAILGTILKHGGHLLNVINDILDLSKIEAGKLNLEIQATSVDELLSDLQSFAEPKCLEGDIALHIDNSIRSAVSISTDATRIRQILFNLLSNAVKFTDAGSVTLRVEAISNQIVFSVVDTGIGMSTEQLSRIFESFEQAEESTTRKYGGSGLGLTIAKYFAVALGGDITVESTLGKGSTFSLILPFEEVSPINSPAILQGPESPSSMIAAQELVPPILPAQNPKALVLIVDDSIDNRHILTHFLKKAAIESIAVENGLEAIQVVQQRDVDLILMDMQMPVCGGIKATETLRELGVTIPILAISASYMDDDQAAYRNAGCTDSIAKPFKRSALVEKVNFYLRAVRPAFDRDYFDDPDLAPIIAEFILKLPERVTLLSRLLEEESWDQLVSAAHVLGSSGIFGFSSLSIEAAKLEKAAKQASSTAVVEALTKVKAEVEQAINAWQHAHA